MTPESEKINGWTVLAHPCFQEQITNLTEQVEKEREKNPDTFQGKRCTKLLDVVRKVINGGITVNPSGNEYRQGNTLGEGYRGWRRAKFAAGRYRLFFRYDTQSKIIILAWMNDETTLRTYGSKSDAYRVFKGMLEDGNPPDDWAELVEESNDSRTFVSLMRVVK